MDYRAALVPLNGGPPVEITKDMIVVGRTTNCELRLNHKSISKLHCVVVKTDGLLVLRDLGSTNGTRVNGTRVRRAVLLPRDKLSFANHHFVVHLGPADVPVSGLEHTQAIEPEDDALAEDGDEAESSAVKMQRNELPDVYPENDRGTPS